MALPILRLKVAGYCSPLISCNLNNDAATAKAACNLQCLKIDWYRKVKPNDASSTNSSNNTSRKDDLSPPLLKRQTSYFRSTDLDSEIYVKLEAVLSVCDTNSGPAIELRTTSKDFVGILEKHDLADINKKMDVITNLSGSENSFPILERIIPLSMIECAALGGKWDLNNILNVGGSFDCDVKVYSCE